MPDVDINRSSGTHRWIEAYTNEDFAEVITAIADGTLDPSPLVSSTISLDDASEKGLNHLLGEGRNSEVKILVRP